MATFGANYADKTLPLVLEAWRLSRDVLQTMESSKRSRQNNLKIWKMFSGNPSKKLVSTTKNVMKLREDQSALKLEASECCKIQFVQLSNRIFNLNI